MRLVYRVILMGCVAAISAVSSTVKATGVVAGATEPTQILNNVQLVLSYIEQAQQTEHQFAMMLQGIENLKKTFSGAALRGQIQRMFSDYNMVRSFRDLRNLYVNGQQFAYSGSQTDEMFRRAYPQYGVQAALTGRTYQSRYADWSSSARDAVISSSRMAGIQEDNLMNEGSFVAELQYRVDSADGATSAIQAGAQASLAMVSQLQELRQLQMAQINAQNAYTLKEVSAADNREMIQKNQTDGWADYQAEIGTVQTP